MTTEEKGASAHVAYAEHLKTLIGQARAHLAKGEEIPASLWKKIDATNDKMIEALK